MFDSCSEVGSVSGPRPYLRSGSKSESTCERWAGCSDRGSRGETGESACADALQDTVGTPGARTGSRN